MNIFRLFDCLLDKTTRLKTVSAIFFFNTESIYHKIIDNILFSINKKYSHIPSCVSACMSYTKTAFNFPCLTYHIWIHHLLLPWRSAGVCMVNTDATAPKTTSSQKALLPRIPTLSTRTEISLWARSCKGAIMLKQNPPLCSIYSFLISF